MGQIWDPSFPPGGRRIVLVVHCCLLSFITMASLGMGMVIYYGIGAIGNYHWLWCNGKIALAPWFKGCGFIRCGEIRETCDHRVGLGQTGTGASGLDHLAVFLSEWQAQEGLTSPTGISSTNVRRLIQGSDSIQRWECCINFRKMVYLCFLKELHRVKSKK